MLVCECVSVGLTLFTLHHHHWRSWRFKHWHKCPSSYKLSVWYFSVSCIICALRLQDIRSAISLFQVQPWRQSVQTATCKQTKLLRDSLFGSKFHVIWFFIKQEPPKKLYKEWRLDFLHLFLKDVCLYQFQWIYTASVLKTKTEPLHISKRLEWEQNCIRKFIWSLYGGQLICSVLTSGLYYTPFTDSWDSRPVGTSDRPPGTHT